MEVLVLVLALQIQLPRQFFLLRGNHETKSVNKNYGFHGDLRLRFPDGNESEILLDAVAKATSACGFALQQNPLPSWWPLAKISSSRGSIEPAGLVEDLLWSDPSPLCTGFKANTERGCSYVFGSDVVAERCAKLGILMIVRGHQVKK
uniref:protein-serine/threonine phosphatase n=1 Tax=Angiostrongylus cantonensis TaxID=6313 RepID=A0A158P8X6_ANGCA